MLWLFLLGGAGSVGSYSLAIWAATQAPLALVAAFVLREQVGLPRWIAVGIVAAGVILLRAG